MQWGVSRCYKYATRNGVKPSWIIQRLQKQVLVDHFFGSVPIDYGNALSLRLLWIVLAACGFVALINLLYGGLIQISARQYAQHLNQMN